MGGDLGRAWVCGRVAGVHGEKKTGISAENILDHQFFSSSLFSLFLLDLTRHVGPL